MKIFSSGQAPSLLSSHFIFPPSLPFWPCFQPKATDGATEAELKRRSSGRAGIGRRSFRGMRRIMGKKVTPPDSPTPSTAYGEGQPPEQSPSLAGRVLIPHSAAFSSPPGESERMSESSTSAPNSRPSSSTRISAVGKAFLEVPQVGEGRGDRGGRCGVGGGDDSPNATESLSTSHASPSSNYREEQSSRVL